MRMTLTFAAFALAATLAGSAAAARQQPDADAHRGWMDDAGDLQEDLREAVRSKDGAKVVEASAKMETLMAQTERYWAAKNAADIVKLAQEARAQSKQMGDAARAGKFEEADQAFTTLSTTCNTCHDLHPEKR